ncbi:MAG: transcription termination/antitermination protein NusA [Leptospiraceae bacterium]|nr:transcription termination/antitermination protein NusA [Leptospiraceae bacterium]
MARKAKSNKNAEPDIKAFFNYLNEISRDKSLALDDVFDVVRGSFETAYQKKFGQDANLEVILDQEKPEIAVIRRRRVVEKVLEPVREISLADAQAIQGSLQINEYLEEKEYPFDFSRIGASNVRQILMQRLKELEREIVYNEFKDRVGDLVNGYFLRWRDRDIYVDLGSAEGLLPRREQIPNERFRSGDRIKAVITAVELRRERSREPGPFITLSRASGDFVRKLFEMEIPEIYEGVVEIMDITRHPGYRTKLMVRSNRFDVDPVGACVGIRGVRIQSIVRELGNERIDIVHYSEEAEVLIENALSPAKVLEVRADLQTREALVVVPDESYSLAIGMNGQNVKLASQLTDFKLIVKSQTQFSEEMSSPEARAELEALFHVSAQTEEAELDYTPINELPNITKRVIDILNAAGIKSVEELVEMDEEELTGIEGMGKATARQVMSILSEVVEYE